MPDAIYTTPEDFDQIDAALADDAYMRAVQDIYDAAQMVETCMYALGSENDHLGDGTVIKPVLEAIIWKLDGAAGHLHRNPPPTAD